MFVKILTMHRIINYGSFLQAYALMKIIESYGHNVEFCDFVAGEARHNGSKVQPPSLFDRLKEASLAPFTHLKKRKFFKETKKCFHNIAWKELKLTKENNLSYTCDCLVVGSDEVFNYTQNHGFGYVPQFFGHGLDASSIFAFAASAGYANIKDIENDNMENEIGSGLNKFSSISVRDENTYDIVEKYSRHKPSQVIDPTLLYDFELETNAKHKKFNKKRYLIIYAYTGRLDTKKDIKVIKEYTKKNNLTTISLGFFHGWCDHNLVVTPFELLSLFKDAEAVLTDTFHGSIFSIKFKKPFVSLLRVTNKKGSNSNKLGYLLTQLGLQDRINHSLEELESQMNKPIDYDHVCKTIQKYKKDSIQFMTDALDKAKKDVMEITKS